MVRAKFVVVSLTKSTMWSGSTREIGTTIKLVPVISGSQENEEFFRYTPTGTVELGTLNEKAAEEFQIGSAYYLDFTKAE